MARSSSDSLYYTYYNAWPPGNLLDGHLNDRRNDTKEMAGNADVPRTWIHGRFGQAVLSARVIAAA